MENEELDNIIVLNDEQGNEVKFEFLDLVELDEEVNNAINMQNTVYRVSYKNPSTSSRTILTKDVNLLNKTHEYF